MPYLIKRYVSDELPNLLGFLNIGVGPRYHIENLIYKFELTPIRVAILYLIFGLGALYAFDVLLVRWVAEPRLSRLQAVKGFVEVVVTAGLIFGLTSGSRAPLELKNERLQRQREELDVLHRVMRHNMRNSLNSIIGYSELIKERTETEQTNDWCETLLENVQDLLHLTRQTSRIRGISTDRGVRTTTVDISEVVRRVTESIDIETKIVELQLELPDVERVRAHPMLEVAIEELLRNAIEHNHGAAPAVTITVDPGEGLVSETRIHITDNGPGLPNHAVEVLERAREEQLMHMQGLGLWMVHWIVAESFGTMTIDTGEWGTEVTLTVPSAFEFGATATAAAAS